MWNRVASLAWSLTLAVALLIPLIGMESRSADAVQVPRNGRTSVVTDGPIIAAQPVAQETPTGDAYCQTCHADESLSTGFSNGQTLPLSVDTRVLRDSAHELLSCVTCHEQLGTHPDENGSPPDFDAYQTQAIEMCARCHLAAVDGYEGSAHWDPTRKDAERATCIDCHSPDGSGHSVGVTGDPESILGPARVAGTCGRCHDSALGTYKETSHGKVARFGDAATTATCISCHSDHEVEAVRDLAKPTAVAELVAGCARCHEGADESFFRAWPGHSEGAPAGSTADFFGRLSVFMAAAIVAAGLVHVSLDYVRRLSDRNHRSG